MALRLAELAVRFGCELRGDPDTQISHVATLHGADTGDITFLANPQYKKFLAETRASAVVLDPDSAEHCPVASLVSKDPYLLYAKIASVIHPQPQRAPGVDNSAAVADGAVVSGTAHIGANAVLETGAVIGDHVVVGPGCVVQENAKIGDHSRLVANVTVCHGVIIGERVLIHPGAVIGADGFGIAPSEDGWVKVPQVGSVRIENDVEIGANTTIDRGAIDDTVIERGAKLDNLIQIAHNVRVGAHTVIAACVGISGSTEIGSRCMVAGQAGFVGHIKIADDTVIGARALVSQSVKKPGGSYAGAPMEEASSWKRNYARLKRLDDLFRRVMALERSYKSNKNGNQEDD